MTATEMLVSSRLMKTDNSPPQEAVTRNKKAAGRANRRMEGEGSPSPSSSSFKQEKKLCCFSSDFFSVFWIRHCFSNVISASTPSTLFPPCNCLDTPTPPPLPSSHTHKAAAATWTCMKMLVKSGVFLKSKMKEEDSNVAKMFLIVFIIYSINNSSTY